MDGPATTHSFGRSLVGVGGLSGSAPVADEQQVHDLLGGLGPKLSDPSDDHALLWVVTQVKIARGGDEEVADHLVVDFDVGDEYFVVVVRVFFDGLEYVADGQNTI